MKSCFLPIILAFLQNVIHNVYSASAKRQAGQVSRHLHVFTNFRVAKIRKNSACWGAPQTRNFGPSWPEVGALRLLLRSCSLRSISLLKPRRLCCAAVVFIISLTQQNRIAHNRPYRRYGVAACGYLLYQYRVNADTN